MTTSTSTGLSQLDLLEAEGIHVMREVAAEFEKPALLFSGGKDSIVMVKLAEKAFWPGKIPFPLVHVDTGHNFEEVLAFRDWRVEDLGARLVVGSVQDDIDAGRVHEVPGGLRNPLQTTTLLRTIEEGRYDAVFGGARRDEEKARAKERFFSFRDSFGQWDPKNQRPELWNLYNGRHNPGEHIRVFPLSNWTELDIWRYIVREKIAVPSIYYAHEREVFERDGMILGVTEHSLPKPGETVTTRVVRYRTVGDASCTGAVLSPAATAEEVLDEVAATRITERGATRADDRASEAAMEDRKKEGYFLVAGLLRFATAGSVDDGKSTLIGRLLYDSKSVFTDQLEAVEKTSSDRGDDYTNLALLTDGLRAEREQGITIDVAYRYFATPARTFIVADTPGHVQYTRNMVTGASTADVALVLVDARKGVIEQTRRHASLSALLRVPHLVLAVNKMDLVDWDQAVYDTIVADFREFAGRLALPDVVAIPMAALAGDNVVHKSDNMPWYDGPALLEFLEGVEVDTDHLGVRGARFPVQYVIRPMSVDLPDYRGYAGTLATGTLKAGDEVVVLPSGRRTTVAAVETADGPLDQALARQALTVRLTDEVDVSRGDLIAAADDAPTVTSEFEATVCWMTDAPLVPGRKMSLKHTTRTVKAVVTTLVDTLDVTTLESGSAASFGLNDIGRVIIRTSSPVFVDDYIVDRTTGAFVLIDDATGATVAAGMVGTTLGNLSR